MSKEEKVFIENVDDIGDELEEVDLEEVNFFQDNSYILNVNSVYDLEDFDDDLMHPNESFEEFMEHEDYMK